MAFPPLNISETAPGDSDIVSQFPSAERTFRTDLEDFLEVGHNTVGFNEHQSITTAARDAITSWTVGNLIFNTTTKQLQFTTAIDSDVWYSEGVPTATRTVFQQTSAPTGWTKDSTATYNEAVMCGTTGSVGTAGSVSSETLFARTGTDAVTLVAGNIPSLTSGNFGFTSSLPNHVHSAGTYALADATIELENNGEDEEPWVQSTVAYSHGEDSTGVTNGGSGRLTDVDLIRGVISIADPTVSGSSGNPTTNPSVTATITYTNGSQTTFTPAIDCRVKRFSVIVATKD